MKTSLKYFFTFFAGFVCASVFFVSVILPKNSREKFEYGYHNGMVEAQFQLADKIPATLGSDLHLSDGHNEFFSVKDVDIVTVERNGVKTLRVYDHDPKD